MRSKKVVLILMVAGLALALTPGAVLAGSGCSKPKAAESAKAEGETGKPCCPKMADEAALAALKQAADEKGCPKTAEAVAAAEVALQKASTHSGCEKTDAAAHEAALVAMQKAAEMAGCAKAKKAVADAVEIAHAADVAEPATEQAQ